MTQHSSGDAGDRAWSVLHPVPPSLAGMLLEEAQVVRVLPTFPFFPSVHGLYFPNNWQAALQEYSSIAEKLSLTNFAMQRDVREGQARCLARLGRHEEALAVATCLVSESAGGRLLWLSPAGVAAGRSVIVGVLINEAKSEPPTGTVSVDLAKSEVVSGARSLLR